MMLEVKEYVTSAGAAPFSAWFMRLADTQTRARIAARINRIRAGNLGDCKSLGDGLMELRFFFGPGYRVYFGRDGSDLVILLGGGDKKTQSRDVARARAAWNDYRGKNFG